KLQCQLNEPRITCRLRLAKSRRSELGSDVLNERVGIRESRIHVIECIKELRAKLKTAPFIDRKSLEQRNVPILEARSKNDIAPGIAERPLNRVSSKCARVKQRSRNTRFSIWIANYVWTRRVGNGSTAIGIGKVGSNIRRRIPIAGRGRGNA